MTSALTDAAVDQPVPRRLLRALVVLGLMAAVLLTAIAMLTARQTASGPAASVGPAGVAQIQRVPQVQP